MLLNKEFYDLEDFAHSIRSWDIDFLQLDCGKFRSDLLQVDLSDFKFLYTRFNRHLVQRGSSPPNLYTFALPAYSSQRIIWHGKELPENSIMVYSPGMEIDGITWSDFNVFTFSLTLEMIENLGKVSGYPGGRNLFCNTDVLTCHRSVIRKFRQLLRSFCSQIENGHSAVVKHEFYGKFNSEILDQLLAAIVSSRPVKYSDSSRLRDRALKKAITYISEFSQECPTVQMISQETDVTTRTLEYAFLECFGVPPKTYLQAFRLNGVYREFRRRDPSSTKVIDVANHWGFWHMGQFASDYRKLFGELPSETLRKP